MKIKEINTRLSLRSILLYEQLFKKSFYLLNDEEDFIELLYCIFLCSTDYTLTFGAFIALMEDESLAKKMMNNLTEELQFFEQFNEGEAKETKKEIKDIPYMTDNVKYLIGRGMDIDYLMNKMKIWELPVLIDAYSTADKNELEMSRLWTYLDILPHIDGKKLKSPSELIAFPWEKEEIEKQRQVDFKKKEKAIRALFKMDKEETNDGEK